VIFRGFGHAGVPEMALRLAEIARRRGLVLLIGADESLAARVGADGVHLPERMYSSLHRMKARRPDWIITLAAHSPSALRRAASVGADAVMLSTVFKSRSPTAARPIGAIRLARLVRSCETPIFALGGVQVHTVKQLIGSGVAGLAAVEAFADATA
jgi:thiamine-phosphate pyrophosphorylase